MRTFNPNLEPEAEALAEMEARKAEIRAKKEQAENTKAVETRRVTTGRMDGISNRPRGLHE